MVKEIIREIREKIILNLIVSGVYFVCDVRVEYTT